MKSVLSIFLGLSSLASVSFGQVTFQTIDKYVPNTGRLAGTEIVSISNGNIAGYAFTGETFVVYNGTEYNNLQPMNDGNIIPYGGMSRGMVALRGNNLLMQERMPYARTESKISQNNAWQSNSGWTGYRQIYSGYDSDSLLMTGLSETGTSVGNFCGGSTGNHQWGYFFDINGNKTQIYYDYDTCLTGVFGNNVVGYAYGSSVMKGFVWNNGVFTDIVVPDAYWTRADGIYENLIVGSYGDNNNGASHGFLYDGSNYFTVDVPGAKDTYFRDISGTQAVGSYTTADGITHGFVASSIPEPSTLSLLAPGGVVVALRRRKR